MNAGPSRGNSDVSRPCITSGTKEKLIMNAKIPKNAAATSANRGGERRTFMAPPSILLLRNLPLLPRQPLQIDRPLHRFVTPGGSLAYRFHLDMRRVAE